MKAIYEYATKSWPVVKGCDNTLPCAARCWARRECHRLAANPNPKVAALHPGLTDERGNWTGTVKLNEAHLQDPLHWCDPQRVAVAYHGDLFLASDEVIDWVVAVMALCPQHTFLVLTKRAALMGAYLAGDRYEGVMTAMRGMGVDVAALRWPLPNVWLGVSITNQADADERIPLLLQTPAARRWVSIEPLVGPVNLAKWTWPMCWHWDSKYPGPEAALAAGAYAEQKPQGLLSVAAADRLLKWVVLGGESGPDARAMNPAWVRSVRDQCQAAGVPFFFKQWGDWQPLSTVDGRQELPFGEYLIENGVPQFGFIRKGKQEAGRLLDGREWNELPGTSNG